MEHGLLSWAQVRALTSLSRATVWRLERAGRFPRRRQIGPNRIAWIRNEVQTWIDTRPTAKRSA